MVILNLSIGTLTLCTQFYSNWIHKIIYQASRGIFLEKKRQAFLKALFQNSTDLKTFKKINFKNKKKVLKIKFGT